MENKYTQEEAELINAALSVSAYYAGSEDTPRTRAYRRLQKAVDAYKRRVRREPDRVRGMHVKYWIAKHTELELQ